MKIQDLSLEEFNKMSFSNPEDEVVHIKKAVERITPSQRYPIGFKEFNQAMNGGFKNGDLVIISGISGQGKTTYAQSLTYYLCKEGIGCLWFSYEVALEFINKKFEQMGIEDFYSVYTPKKNTSGKLDWLKSKIKESWVKHATKVVFIDHIDFLTPDDVKSSDNQSIALKKIAIELKSLAIELEMVIVCMAHLKKTLDNKEIDMQDIGYSAGIFQLADYVFLIQREKEEQGLRQNNSGNLYTDNSLVKLVKNRETGVSKYLKVIYAENRFQPFVDIDERSYPNVQTRETISF